MNLSHAQDRTPTPERPTAERTIETPALPAEVTTRHTIQLPGGPLAYTVTVGALTMRDEQGRRKADIAFTHYARTTQLRRWRRH